MLAKVFPFLAWFKGYDTISLQLDALLGPDRGPVLIPQSMAYAQLADRPLITDFMPSSYHQ